MKEIEYSVLKENPDSTFKCKKCPSVDIWYESGETSDGAYDIYWYRCASCGHNWKVVREDD